MKRIFNQRFGELTKLTSNTFPDLVRNRYLTDLGKDENYYRSLNFGKEVLL